MTFGDSLYRWRKGKGLTQQELAVAVGVNVSYVSNLERNFSATTKSGKPRPSEDLCSRLSKVLGVPLDEVRLAAGYAPHSEAASFNFENVRIALLDKDLTPEDAKEIAEDMELAYRLAIAKRQKDAERR